MHFTESKGSAYFAITKKKYTNTFGRLIVNEINLREEEINKKFGLFDEPNYENKVGYIYALKVVMSTLILPKHDLPFIDIHKKVITKFTSTISRKSYIDKVKFINFFTPGM